MLTPIEVEALHDEWARIERIHREVVAKPDREERLGYYLRLLEEDHLHPGSLVGVATTTDDFALAGGCVATLLDMGMRMPFVNQLAAHVLGHDPALWPLFEPYRDNPKPTISAAMIVRDEEAVLGDCLSALLPFVDQCVVVDTGSVDGTVEIADSYGVEVHHHPWENDYGLAPDPREHQGPRGPGHPVEDHQRLRQWGGGCHGVPQGAEARPALRAALAALRGQ